jgi:hypothetical protein
MPGDREPHALMGDRPAEPGPPALSRREAAEVEKAARIAPKDIDAAGAMWRKYAGDLAGLFDAGPDGGA